ncbi:hypothetical protein KGA66_25675 [Actinocrinis puniceicyclus]|uniref:Uncharacterized protein n=1 Tax=Actinocrinis puniceicyclus TaxID=977794 RepID=A0A8J8BDP5_9ACTN|nr:hypothetical protein [Actinocrinis puniceicyclus]MBS2966457.1 hypothetical protein [Actinocrinis puniceicyclus]
MAGGEGAAAFKGIAQGADEALGNAGHALGDFVENTAQTADKTTDAMLVTEEQNTQAIAKVMSGGAASQERAAASAAETTAAASGEPSRFSGILDPQGAAAGWEGEGGLRLSPEENAAADRFLAQARDAEANITPVVMGIRDKVPGAQTVGYPDFVLKGPASFKRKLATELSIIPGRDMDAALSRMKDTVRYTLKFPGDGTAYTDGVSSAIGSFRESGVGNVDFKPNWRAEARKAIRGSTASGATRRPGMCSRCSSTLRRASTRKWSPTACTKR